jgi:hypothetical protein
VPCVLAWPKPAALSTAIVESKPIRSSLDCENDVVLLLVLWDACETTILPRRVTRKFRLTRLSYRSTWRPWRALSHLLREAKQRDLFLVFMDLSPCCSCSLFGPLVKSLVLLFCTGRTAQRAKLRRAESA